MCTTSKFIQPNTVLINIWKKEEKKKLSKGILIMFVKWTVIIIQHLQSPRYGVPRKLFFLFLHENVCCGYSLEVPRRGASNEYPQHMFSCRIKKNINTFWLKKKAPNLELRNYILHYLYVEQQSVKLLSSLLSQYHDEEYNHEKTGCPKLPPYLSKYTIFTVNIGTPRN